MLKPFLIFLFSAFSIVSWSYEWEESINGCGVRLSIPKEKLSVDEVLDVTLEYWAPEGMAFDLPSLLEGIWVSNGGLKLVSDRVDPPMIQLQFDPWVLGSISLIFSKLHFVGKENVEFFSDVIPIEITPPVGLNALESIPLEILPLQDSVPLKLTASNQSSFDGSQQNYLEEKKSFYFHSSYLLSWGWVLLLLVLICGMGVLLYFKKNPRLLKGRSERDKDPRKEAQKALLELYEENLPKKGKIELYYTRLTDICRRYIEEVFCIQAPEQTTEEFFLELAHTSSFSESFKNKLREFLNSADLVKFARYSSSIKECDEAFHSADELVQLE